MVIFRFSGDTFAFAKHIGMETGFCKYASSAGYWTNLTKDLLSKQNFCYRFINHRELSHVFHFVPVAIKWKICVWTFRQCDIFSPGNNSIGKQGTSYFFRKSWYGQFWNGRGGICVCTKTTFVNLFRSKLWAIQTCDKTSWCFQTRKSGGLFFKEIVYGIWKA